MSFNVTNPYQTFYDSTGAVRAGGFVTFYENRTSTKTTIYSDDALTITQNNPYELDAAGRITGDVKFQGLVTMQTTNADGSDVRTDDDVTTSFPTAIVGDSIQEVDDLTALRALTPSDSSAVIYLRYHTIDGNGGGHFRGVTGAAASTYTDDDGITIVPTGGDGSAAWLRDYSGAVDVRWFGAIGNGSTDDTAAIQAAIDYYSSGQGTVLLPVGTYLVTSTITIAQDRVHLIGDGQFATLIDFEPTANDICFLVDEGTSVIYQGSIKKIGFYSDDVTYDKTCIKLMDHSGYQVDRVGTVFPHVTGGTESIFLRIEGREHGQISNIYAKADTPISIGVIAAPHTPSGISIDNHNFHNMSLLSNGTQIVKIDTGVLLTQVSFTGIQSWVGGDYGLYWLDTTSAAVSNGLSLNNVKLESGTDATAYLVYIDHNTTLQGLTIKGGQGGDRKGFYLRNIDSASFDTFYYTGTLEAMNIDSTVRGLRGDNCFWQAASTTVITGQTLTYAVPKNPNTGALPPSFVYDQSANAAKTVTIGPIAESFNTTMADAAVITLDAGASMIFVADSGNAVAQFVTKGGVAGTTEVSDYAGLYSVTKDTATSTNIYAEAGVYKLQNNRGAEVTYSITIIGNG